MSARTITVWGARGGHGATTVAVALAAHAAQYGPAVVLSADSLALAALAGVPLGPAGQLVGVTPTLAIGPETADPAGALTVVVDAGSPPAATERVEGGEHYVILRGPCYVALASLLSASPWHLDGVIVLAEPGRSLTERDVSEVLDLPVVATVAASPAVARAIDAGLLASRVTRLRELRTLRALALDPYAGRLRPSTARSCQAPLIESPVGTDLPLSQSDNGVERAFAVNSVALSASRKHVGRVWEVPEATGGAEHRALGAGCGRLLHRRGRHVGRGLLHRQG